MRKLLARQVFHPLFLRREGITYRPLLREFQQELACPKDLAESSLTRIKSMLEYAYTNSPFYRALYDKHGFSIDHFQTFDDLKKVPILEKSHLAANMDAILPSRYSKKDLIATATGGTTGNSFKFYYDKECYAKRYALTLYANQLVGWQVGDPAALVWNAHQDLTGVKGVKAKIRNILANRSEVFNAQKINEKKLKGWVALLKRKSVEILYGYAHSINEIAKYVIHVGATGFNIRLVVTTAEPLYDAERETIQKAFHCIVVDRYASREHGPMAQECPNGIMHYFPNSVFIEVCEGDLLVTDFWNKAVPFIRYRIGDAGETPVRACECGSKLPSLGKFTGRDTDFLKAQDGSMVAGMTLHEVYYNEADDSFGRSQIQNIQFVQDRLNHVLVRIVQGQGFDRNYEERYIEQILHSFLGENMLVSYEYVDHIPKTSSGKYRFVINAI